MFAIGYTDYEGVLHFVKHSTPRSINWTDDRKKAKLFSSHTEAESSADFSRIGAVSHSPVVIDVGSGK